MIVGRFSQVNQSSIGLRYHHCIFPALSAGIGSTSIDPIDVDAPHLVDIKTAKKAGHRTSTGSSTTASSSSSTSVNEILDENAGTMQLDYDGTMAAKSAAAAEEESTDVTTVPAAEEESTDVTTVPAAGVESTDVTTVPAAEEESTEATAPDVESTTQTNPSQSPGMISYLIEKRVMYVHFPSH